MKTLLRTVSAFALLASAPVQAQNFTMDQVQYWIGTGADSSVLVIDFQDGTDDASYAWGWLHDGGTGEDMVNAIAAADPNLTAEVTGGFLNSITYGSHAGIGGSPNYWSTWDGSSVSNMVSNLGLSTELGNGDWFGCSYTDFNPALAPTEPIAAFDPFGFTADDVAIWVGAGTDTAILVVDFQDGSGHSSFAWGYLYSGEVTAETMLNDVAAADPLFAVVTTGGFLGDVTYGNFAGIGGSPDYWSTWSATDLGNWATNLGISTTLANGGFFGCSYTDFNPAIRPGTPVAASNTSGIAEAAVAQVNVWPQPAKDLLYVSTTAQGQQPVSIYNSTGNRVFHGIVSGTAARINVGTLAPGLYVLQVGSVKRAIVVQ